MRTAVFLLALTSLFVGLALRFVSTSTSERSRGKSLGTKIGALAAGRGLPLTGRLRKQSVAKPRAKPRHKLARRPAARESGGRLASRSTLKASYRLVLAVLAYGAGLALLTVLAVRWLTKLLEGASL